MDENNVNKNPFDPADVEENNVENSMNEAEETVENEAEDYQSEPDNVCSDGVVEAENENENMTEEAEENDSLATEENTEPVKKKKKGKGAKAAIIILVIIMALAIAGTVAVFIGSRPPKIDLDQVALTVEDVDSSAAEFYQAYMYYYSYNSYYQYPEDELKELAIDNLVLTNALYAEATEKGYTITDEIQAQIDEQLAGIKVTAESSSMTADEYLDKALCPGFTLDMYKSMLEKSMIAQEYYAEKMEAVEKQYEGDNGKTKVEAEYKENKLDYDLTDVSYWYFAASEENAQANAVAVIAQVNGGKTFVDAVKSVSGDENASPNKLKGHSKASLEKGKFTEEAIEWIFAENEDGTYKNGAGSMTTIADESKVYVFYVNNAPQRDETHPAGVYYIQVDVSKDSSIKTENELKIEAKSTADAILAEFEATDKAAASFMNLITKHNEGDNDLVSGDVFELMNDGSEDAAVEEWAFDESRKAGDYALVECDDCYYILFFDNKAENAVWYDTILNSLISNEAKNIEETLLTASKETMQINEEVIDEVIAYVKNMVSSQYAY